MNLSVYWGGNGRRFFYLFKYICEISYVVNPFLVTYSPCLVTDGEILPADEEGVFLMLSSMVITLELLEILSNYLVVVSYCPPPPTNTGGS